MNDYKTSVKLNVPIQSAYDCSIKYFQSIGYQVKKTLPPSRIEFSKKRTTFLAFDEIDSTHDLKVYITQEPDGIAIVFHFEFPLGAGRITERSKNIIESEIVGLTGLITSTHLQNVVSAPDKDRICVECKKRIPWDANLCPYCGHDYRQKNEKDK